MVIFLILFLIFGFFCKKKPRSYFFEQSSFFFEAVSFYFVKRMRTEFKKNQNQN